MVITNIQSILNEQTVRKFPSWNYTHWPYINDDFTNHIFPT